MVDGLPFEERIDGGELMNQSMKKLRIIPRLDVKGPNVVKGLQLEGLRIVGKPTEFAKRYYEQGADEILYIDIVASLYERHNLIDIVDKTTSAGVFIPLTVGGGVRKLDDVRELLRAGADKVAINTAATRDQTFITKAVEMFGSQCIVGSIEAKYKNGKWEAYVDNGREPTGLDAIEWAQRLVELGVGELLVTSIDREGMKQGYDLELIRRVAEKVSVPVIGCGGAGSVDHLHQCLTTTGADAACFGTILHYNTTTISAVKDELLKRGLALRPVIPASLLSVSSASSRKIKKTVSIIDYNVGNLKSVVSAFRTLGNPVKIITTADEIRDAELLVLPGDGAFGYAMDEMHKRGFVEPLKAYIAENRPLLGLCLGMQILMTESEEFGHHRGLDIIKGKVVRLKPQELVQDPSYRVPHMGWNSLIRPPPVQWKGSILADTLEHSLVYFVHSYCVIPDDWQHSLANTVYGGQEFCTVIRKGNVFGTQFHPEKSGPIGMRMINYFSNL